MTQRNNLEIFHPRLLLTSSEKVSRSSGEFGALVWTCPHVHSSATIIHSYQSRTSCCLFTVVGWRRFWLNEDLLNISSKLIYDRQTRKQEHLNPIYDARIDGCNNIKIMMKICSGWRFLQSSFTEVLLTAISFQIAGFGHESESNMERCV